MRVCDRTVAAAAVLALSSVAAHAVPLLDQAWDVIDVTSVSAVGTVGPNVYQQGVTAGLTGKLSAVDLYVNSVFPSYPYFIDTFSLFVNLGAPFQTDAADYRANVTVTTAGWHTFDLSAANIFVNAGDQFAIGFGFLGLPISIDPGFDLVGPFIGTDFNGGYAGGALYALSPPIFPNMPPRLFGPSDTDIYFRTYVEPTSVTEPGTIALLGLGLLGIGLIRRRAH